MADIQNKHPESREPAMTKIATAIQQAYPESVSTEVAQLLTNFDKLPAFSQNVARKVLVALPNSRAANDDKFIQKAVG